MQVHVSPQVERMYVKTMDKFNIPVKEHNVAFGMKINVGLKSVQIPALLQMEKQYVKAKIFPKKNVNPKVSLVTFVELLNGEIQ